MERPHNWFILILMGIWVIYFYNYFWLLAFWSTHEYTSFGFICRSGIGWVREYAYAYRMYIHYVYSVHSSPKWPSSSVQELQLLYSLTTLHMFVYFYPFIFLQILSLSTSVKTMPDFDYFGHTDQYAEKWHFIILSSIFIEYYSIYLGLL